MNINSHALPSSYDDVPYPSSSHVFAHPDSLATSATLLGLSPPRVEHCRVLELGSAGGGNLVPIALQLPNSEFLGVDASAVQIHEAETAVKTLGLGNIEFRQLDILDINADLGQFDYIISHGVFSWVPEAVRDKILAICREHLAPNGVAYISYNTYPGWHMLGAVRQMMLYHTRSIQDPQMRIAQARSLLEFLTDSAVAASESSNSMFTKFYATFLRSEREHLGSNTDAYLFHEELEEVNDPLYFYQFAEWAARHGLQYLCEGYLSDVFLNEFPSEVTDTLLKMSHDIIELEQYMDFLRNRSFRKTLLVHQEVPISRRLHPDRVQSLYVASGAQPVSENLDIGAISIVEFGRADGVKLATDHPVTKAALICLADIWPRAVHFETLLDMAYGRLSAHLSDGDGTIVPGASSAQRMQDAEVLAANLLKGFAYSARLVELHTFAPQFVTHVSERPVASPWARFQAQMFPVSVTRANDRSGQISSITNMCHERVEVKGLARFLLSHLDGTRDRAALLEGLAQSLVDGTLEVRPVSKDGSSADAEPESEPVTDIEQARQILSEDLDTTLKGLARTALLVH